MIIEKIIFENYRQYKNVEIPLSSKKLNLFIGKMGVGKTNLLNAINWCLYYNEPYLSRKEEDIQLPIMNLKTIADAEKGEIKDVKVEIWVKINGEQPLIFTRKASFIIAGENNHPTPYRSPEFKVRSTDDRGNTEIYEGEDAEHYVERFVPTGIKEFFFFDGERLDKYFKESTRENIRHSIFQISQTSLLNSISENLNKIKQDFRKEAGKRSPNIDCIRTQLETIEKNQLDAKRRIDECKRQIKIANDNIQEYEEKLSGVPKVDDIKSKITELEIKLNDKELIYESKITEKRDLLYENGIILLNYPAIEKVIQIIAEKRKKGEIPPTGDLKLLQKILDDYTCSICGSKFSSGSSQEKSVKKLMDGIDLSSEIGHELMRIESPLTIYQNIAKKFNENIRKISQDIESYKKDLDEITKNIGDLKSKIIGFNDEKISNWAKQKKSFEDVRDRNNQNLGVQEENLKTLKKDYERLNEELADELKRESKLKTIKKKIDFIETTVNVAESIKNKIMEQIRKKISEETKKKFFELHWKKESFNEVCIDEDYDISITNSMGFPCLGSISGGEREILALSFTMSLHRISGFDAPILIDRPLTMVSGESIDYVCEAFLNIAKEKQLILFLTPNEYKGISQILNSKTCHMFELKMTKDEKELVVIEV